MHLGDLAQHPSCWDLGHCPGSVLARGNAALALRFWRPCSSPSASLGTVPTLSQQHPQLSLGTNPLWLQGQHCVWMLLPWGSVSPLTTGTTPAAGGLCLPDLVLLPGSGKRVFSCLFVASDTKSLENSVNAGGTLLRS